MEYKYSYNPYPNVGLSYPTSYEDPNAPVSYANQLSFGTNMPTSSASVTSPSVAPMTTVNDGVLTQSGSGAVTVPGFHKQPDGTLIPVQSWSDMTGLQKLSTGMSMASNLANIWFGLQNNRLARDNFNLQKGVLETNLANQIASYNTALEDRVAGRYSQREAAANQGDIQNYLDRNRAVSRM